jgi:hypothetical protein
MIKNCIKLDQKLDVGSHECKEIIERRKKSLFLTIQLFPQFDFGHRTPKPGIFDHPTLKTIYNWSLSGFDG